MIALAVVEVMVDVPVEMIPSMKPGARADEDAAVIPLRPVISVGSAPIRRSLIIAVRAIGLHTDFDCHLRRGLGCSGKKQTCRNRHSRNVLQHLHMFPHVLEEETTANGCFLVSDTQPYTAYTGTDVSEEPQIAMSAVLR